MQMLRVIDISRSDMGNSRFYRCSKNFTPQPDRPSPYPEVTDLICQLLYQLIYLDLIRRRLFSSGICYGYGYDLARELHLLPWIFKGK